MAKGSSKGKKKSEEEESSIALPSAVEMGKSMDARFTFLKEEFSKIKGGQASADMFNHLKVVHDGSSMNLSQVGQISLKPGNKLTINLYDPLFAQGVVECFRESKMSLTPTVEGGAVTVQIPRPSAESRAELVKLASKHADKVI
jgi:ribosome recycling factor